MRDRLECTGCGGSDFWLIEQVLERERDLGLVRIPVWIDGAGGLVGSFELILCAGCGLGEWWAHGVGPDDSPGLPHAKLVQDAPECPGCASSEAWDVPMLDQATGLGAIPMVATLVAGRPANPLSTWVCRPCGLTRWRIAVDPPWVPEAPLRSDRCRACRSERASVVVAQDATVMVGSSTRFLPPPGVAYYETRFAAAGQDVWGPRWWGRFELRVCPDCGHVDWLGARLDELRQSAKFGIRKLSRTTTPTRGPYR